MTAQPATPTAHPPYCCERCGTNLLEASCSCLLDEMAAHHEPDTSVDGPHDYRCECAHDGCPECREYEDEMEAQDREYRRMTA